MDDNLTGLTNQQVYYRSNHSKILEYQRQWYQRNKERVKEKIRNDPDIKEKDRLYAAEYRKRKKKRNEHEEFRNYIRELLEEYEKKINKDDN